MGVTPGITFLFFLKSYKTTKARVLLQNRSKSALPGVGFREREPGPIKVNQKTLFGFGILKLGR